MAMNKGTKGQAGSVDAAKLLKEGAMKPPEPAPSQISYNPYKYQDYKKIETKDSQMKLARGLGSNMGDETWEQA